MAVDANSLGIQYRERKEYEAARERFEQSLELWRGLGDELEYARSLSGGQQKLLELGRLLMLDPQLIILDEPFAGVHPRLRETIWNFVGFPLSTQY